MPASSVLTQAATEVLATLGCEWGNVLRTPAEYGFMPSNDLIFSVLRTQLQHSEDAGYSMKPPIAKVSMLAAEASDSVVASELLLSAFEPVRSYVLNAYTLRHVQHVDDAVYVAGQSMHANLKTVVSALSLLLCDTLMLNNAMDVEGGERSTLRSRLRTQSENLHAALHMRAVLLPEAVQQTALLAQNILSLLAPEVALVGGMKAKPSLDEAKGLAAGVMASASEVHNSLAMGLLVANNIGLSEQVHRVPHLLVAVGATLAVLDVEHLKIGKANGLDAVMHHPRLTLTVAKTIARSNKACESRVLAFRRRISTIPDAAVHHLALIQRRRTDLGVHGARQLQHLASESQNANADFTATFLTLPSSVTLAKAIRHYTLRLGDALSVEELNLVCALESDEAGELLTAQWSGIALHERLVSKLLDGKGKVHPLALQQARREGQRRKGQYFWKDAPLPTASWEQLGIALDTDPDSDVNGFRNFIRTLLESMPDIVKSGFGRKDKRDTNSRLAWELGWVSEGSNFHKLQLGFLAFKTPASGDYAEPTFFHSYTKALQGAEVLMPIEPELTATTRTGRAFASHGFFRRLAMAQLWFELASGGRGVLENMMLGGLTWPKRESFSVAEFSLPPISRFSRAISWRGAGAETRARGLKRPFQPQTVGHPKL